MTDDIDTLRDTMRERLRTALQKPLTDYRHVSLEALAAVVGGRPWEEFCAMQDELIDLRHTP